LVTGVVQQKGTGQPWYKERKDEEAEFEFMVQQVNMLHEVQEKRTEGIAIRLSLDAISQETIDELADRIKESPGPGRLHVSIYNPLNRQQVALTSRSQAVRVTPTFYRWLCNKRQEGALAFTPVERSAN